MLVKGLMITYTVTGAHGTETRCDEYIFRWRAKLAVWLLRHQKDVSNIAVRAFIKEY